MVKDNNVNITIEVCKDKTSGRLYIQAHFNPKAPNVYSDKNYLTWMPTAEEQILLNEAFEFMPMDFSPTLTDFKKPIIEEKKEENTSSNFSTGQETNTRPDVNIEQKEEIIQEKREVTPTIENPQVNMEQREEKTSFNYATQEKNYQRPDVNIEQKEEIIQEKREVTPTIENPQVNIEQKEEKPRVNIVEKQEIHEEKREVTPTTQKPRESDIFEITNENKKTEDIKDQGNKTESTFEKMSKPPGEKQENDEPLSSKIEEDDGIIVEADFDAIEAALEKHIGTKDNTIVEADEKTIIDRVLKQKKKGKWRE